MKSKMLFIAVILFSARLVSAIDDSLYGRPIEYIRLASDFPIDHVAVMSALTVHEKDQLTPEAIRNSLRNIHRLDRFGFVEVHAEPFISGVALTFNLTPDWMIDHIKFKGKQTGYLFAYGLESRVSRKELLRVPEIHQNETFSEAKLEKSIEKLTELYTRFGYGKCIVTAKTERDDTTRTIDIRFDINKGDPSLINRVEFEGNHSIPSDTLLKKMRSVRGRRYLYSALETDRKKLQNVYQKHGYLTVRVDRLESTYDSESNSFDIRVSLTEGPLISLIIQAPYHWWNLLWYMSHFERRPSISMEALGYPDFDTTDVDSLDLGEANLLRRYQDRGYAYASSELVKTAATEEGHEYQYTILEGDVYKSGEVEISGNENLDDNLIRSYMLTDRGTRFNRLDLQKDCDSILGAYLERGFVDASIQSYIRDRDEANRKVTIHFVIQEGNRKEIGSVTSSGSARFTSDEIIEITGMTRGKPFFVTAIDKGIQAVRSKYETSGFPDSEISWRYTETEPGIRDLWIEITEGSYVEFGKILIKGYYRTKLGLIRKQIPAVEYQPYSTESMMIIQRKLSQTGLFSSIRLQSILSESNDSERTILVNLTERPSLFIETGPGYNTDIGASAYLNLYTTNLYGTNRFLGTSIFFAQKAEKSQLTYREPEFAGFPFQMELRLFRNFTDESDYDLYRYGGRVNWTFRQSERFRLILEYRLEEDRPININPGADIPQEYRDTVKIGSLAPSAILDTRDDPRDPRSGSLLSGKIEFARPVYSSEVDFTKTTFEATHFLKFLRRTTLGLSLRIGWGRDLPYQETFKLGGIKTIRGWGYEDIRGPRNTNLVGPGENLNGDGGDMSLLGNVEFRTTLIWGLQGVLFFDSGNVWENLNTMDLRDLKGTLGAGIRFMTPIGPLGLDYGYNVLRDEFDQSQRWSFIIGQTF